MKHAAETKPTSALFDLNKARFGERYGETDVQILWQLRAKKYLQVKRPLTAQEQNGLLEELDRITGRI